MTWTLIVIIARGLTNVAAGLVTLAMGLNANVSLRVIDRGFNSGCRNVKGGWASKRVVNRRRQGLIGCGKPPVTVFIETCALTDPVVFQPTKNDDCFLPLFVLSILPLFSADGSCDGVVCSQHGVCVPKTASNRARQCVCVDGWAGDGRKCVGKRLIQYELQLSGQLEPIYAKL